MLQRRQKARRRAIDRRLRLMMNYRNQRQNRASLAEGAATTRREAGAARECQQAENGSEGGHPGEQSAGI